MRRPAIPPDAVVDAAYLDLAVIEYLEDAGLPLTGLFCQLGPLTQVLVIDRALAMQEADEVQLAVRMLATAEMGKTLGRQVRARAS